MVTEMLLDVERADLSRLVAADPIGSGGGLEDRNLLRPSRRLGRGLLGSVRDRSLGGKFRRQSRQRDLRLAARRPTSLRPLSLPRNTRIEPAGTRPEVGDLDRRGVRTQPTSRHSSLPRDGADGGASPADPAARVSPAQARLRRSPDRCPAGRGTVSSEGRSARPSSSCIRRSCWPGGGPRGGPFRRYPRWTPSCGVATGEPPRIVSPDGSTPYRLRSGSPAEYQKVALIARSSPHPVSSTDRLFWYQDGALVASVDAGEEHFLPLERGDHRLVVVDGAGRSDTVSYRVE